MYCDNCKKELERPKMESYVFIGGSVDGNYCPASGYEYEEIPAFPKSKYVYEYDPDFHRPITKYKSCGYERYRREKILAMPIL